MLKRFLIVFGLIVLYMLVLGGILLLVISTLQDDEQALLIAILSAFVLSIAGFVPYADWAAKRVFRFRGQGLAISEAELRAHIQGINEWQAPIVVGERGKTLVATWKYADAQWWELFARAGLTRVYELRMRFDEARHLVTLIDVTRAVGWRAGPQEVRIGWGGYRGIMAGFEAGTAWGLDDDLDFDELYDYEFSPQEIKTPITSAILKRGWDVRFGIW
ncbi:MAG: hypothetical protein ISS56_04310 [Anaerolineae bacterium]|nr:hypothetical protein [Anaerolineae bacterium]